MPLVKNIVTDYGSPTDGTSDVRAAFLALKADGHGQEVVLTLPQHTYNFHSAATNADKLIFDGLSSLTVIGNNSTITGVEIFLGCDGNPVAVPQSTARVQSVSAGALSVSLITPADASIFTVGRYVALTAIDLQGFGAPPNPYIYEFLKIQSINGGTITFATRLKYGYLSTSPAYNGGDIFGNDLGGPGTLYVLPAGFNCDFDFQDIVFNRTDGQQTLGRGRSIKYTRCSDASGVGIIPSLNQIWTADACDFSNYEMEVDKLVETMVINGGSVRLKHQSPCPNLLTANGASLRFNGTPKKTSIIGGSVSSLLLGAIAYGRTEEFEANGTSISSISAGSYFTDVAPYTIADGLVKDGSGDAVPWAAPGSPMVFSGPKTNETGFMIESLSQSGLTTEIQTDLADGWPNVPKLGGTVLNIRPHPCPVLTLTDCTGCADAVDLSQSGAHGLPIYSYTKRTYTGDTLVSPAGVNIWGVISEIRITVSQAYTGTNGTLTFQPFGQFLTNALDAPDYSSATSWVPVINLKVAGTRVITATSITGAQAGDSITIPGLIWFDDEQTLFCSANVSGESSSVWPIVEIEVIADQGIAIPDEPTRISVGRPPRSVRRHDPDWWEKRPRAFTRQYFNEMKAAEAAQQAAQERADRIKSRPAKQALNRAAQEAAEAIALAKENEVELARMTAALEAARSASDLAETIRQADLAIQYAREIQETEDEAIALLMLH